jgi:VanZ family protein
MRIIFYALKYWTPVFIYSGMVAFLSCTTYVGLPAFPFADKIAHMLEFYVWAFLFIFALAHSSEFEAKKIFAITLVAGLLFGTSLELSQLFTEARCFSYLDILADFIGLIIGGVFIYDRNLSP